MPILKDFRTTKEVVLPSYPDSKVLIYDSLLVGDLMGMDGSISVDSNPASVWIKLIKEWNFTDADGKPMPINVESLKLLKSEDFVVLNQAINKAQGEVKKD